MTPPLPRRRLAAMLASLAAANGALAQEAVTPQQLDSVVVSATRSAARAFDVPASVDIIDGSIIHDGEPMINLSETLPRVPGVFAANRQNYAQDLQISSRGFGARAQFGVRGVRLYQDGIPVTMPDGQGQTGSFNLFSAQRIEVLRGPFSTLYGNASGGVISVFTEDGTPEPLASFNGGAGSYDTYTGSAKLRASTARASGVIAASEFDTDGYRDHSSARRDVVNAKLRTDLTDTDRLTLIGNSQYQPETLDPLGLTRAQWEADPRQVDPSAIQFNTRKTINQVQGGAAYDHSFDADTMLHIDGYGGRRLIRQYLAMQGSLPASSGGVTDLDRNFGGIGARVTWQTSALGTPLKLNVGADTDRQYEHRRGFVNNNGTLGDLRRDEDDTVQSVDGYAEAEWWPWAFLSLTAGVRSSVVRYNSVDHYITTGNPDDSGSRKFSNTSPIFGAVWHATPDLNVYASYGEGFETPTFAEMAYNPIGPGLNFGLNAATSRAVEVGVKWLITPKQRLNAAIFHIDTDQEIVVDAATGGRTTYKNAGATRRKGAELMYDAELPWNLRAHVALTYLDAEFTQGFTTGAPPQPVAPGSKLPGVPPAQAYGELAWVPGGHGGFNTAVEVQYVGKIYVNERNVDAAPAYTVTNVRAGLAQRVGRASLSEFVRVNNVFDRKYAGSVIIGDTNSRFFEPAPPLNWFVGINLDVAL
jgi:iron complex outermembrane receptor protein